MEEYVEPFETDLQRVNWINKNCRSCKSCLELSKIANMTDKEILEQTEIEPYNENECNLYIHVAIYYDIEEIPLEIMNEIGYENDTISEVCKKKQSTLDLYKLSLCLF